MTEDEPRLGWPSTIRTPQIIEKVRQMLAQDWQLMLRLIAEELDISNTPSSVMIWVSGRSAPDLCLTTSQMSRKQNRWKLLETSFPCVSRIHCFWKTSSREIRPVATSSIWISKQQLMAWCSPTSPQLEKSRLQKSKVKTLLITFFDNKDVIYKESGQ